MVFILSFVEFGSPSESPLKIDIQLLFPFLVGVFFLSLIELTQVLDWLPGSANCTCSYWFSNT